MSKAPMKQTEDRNPVEILAEEFLDRRRRGEVVSVDQFASTHPELAKEIQHLFPAMIAMEQFKISKRSGSNEPIEMHFDTPTQLGDYRIIGEIGRGAMGVVYEAEQQSLGRKVAVKVFPRRMLRNSRQLDRFHREARTAASLHHTNIVPVFGVGEQDGLHYFVMQRIDGIALDAVIGGLDPSPDDQVSGASRGKLLASASTSHGSDDTIETKTELAQLRLVGDESSDTLPASSPVPQIDFNNLHGRARWRWVANIGIQVAEAIGYAHAQGVLHRDVKPGNLLLDPRGRVWVTDFGLATVMQAEKEHCLDDVAGTLRFMAPEHLSGEQNARGDIYSLGLTLYELLTRQPAFAEQDRAELIDKIQRGEITPPRVVRPSIPQDLEAVVMKAIACDPQHRYDSAEVFAEDLRRFVDGRPVRARRTGPSGRVRRWARRNPAIASLTAALLLVVVSSFLLVSAKWREAVAENHRAEDNLSLALESMDQILERFAAGWMAQPSVTAVQMNAANREDEAPSAEVEMVVSNYSAAVLEDALKFYDQFARKNATNPQLQRETAKVHRRVADIYQRLGQFDQAENAYKRCLEILESQPISDAADLALEQAATRNQLGLTLHASSRFEERGASISEPKKSCQKNNSGRTLSVRPN